MQLVGYTDRFSVAGGQDIAFMISATAPRYRAALLRLHHGDNNPAGPGFKAEAVASSLEGEYPGREQVLLSGSYVRVPHAAPLAQLTSFSVHLFIRPTTPGKARQALFSSSSAERDGFSLLIEHGCLALEIDGLCVLRLSRTLAAHTWYAISAAYDAASSALSLRQHPLSSTAAELAEFSPREYGAAPPSVGTADVLMGAAWLTSADGPRAGDFYNGKLERPSLYSRALSQDEFERLTRGDDPSSVAGLVACWDFAADIATRQVRDISHNALHGRTVNRPTRAMTGHTWDGSESSWRHAPAQYGAIHCHEDDLDDAGWDVSLRWRVPETLPSGVYALLLRDGECEDYIPFFVRPPRGTTRARILFLAPTFSYLAYANEQMFANPAVKEAFRRMNDGVLADFARDYPLQSEDKYIVANGLRSLYDCHVDGSGVCYSSRLRPIVNMRPQYSMPALNLGAGSPHQFNADLHTLDWLHSHGYDYDVVTDEDLHHEGRALLDAYPVVITGTHNEYWSARMLDALRAYLDNGGRCMYLGGNGFYWVTELDPEDGHTIEIRRMGPATRTWDAAPGEGCLSFTGAQGGLWRYRARPPQALTGIGFTAQGTGPGRPYLRQADANHARAAFVFAGLDAATPIGDFPSLVNGWGAAGFEIDRADHSLGTPRATLLLATASGFSDAYQHVSEEVLVSDSAQGGSREPRVRADMVLLPYPNGGAVFAPGSIAWSGSLSWNAYDNSVSRVTKNVLERFLDPAPI